MIYDNVIEEYLELFDLEDILEQSDLTHLQALTILYQHGHIVLPPFLEDLVSGQSKETAEQDLLDCDVGG